MAIIDSINQEYVDLIKQMDSFHTFNTRINEIQNAEEKPADKIRQSVQHLKSLRGSVDASQLEKLDSIISLCESYLECVDSIIDYKIKLVNYDGKNQTPVLSASERVIAAQKRFELVNKRFSERYEDKADTDKSINKIISTCTGNAMSFIRGKMDELRKKASDIMQEQATVELKLTDSLKQIDYLPNTFLVARSVVQKATKQVLKDIGANDSYEDIFINLRNGGNIVVHANHEQMRDQKIDNFIISYLFRFIESFPAGNVNVHVFDQNPNYIYMRLCNSFQTENASENTKKTVQIHSSVSDLSSFRVVCDDIFKKTSTENPDLYSIYEHDKTDPFNLVIIRGGLVDGSGVAPSEFLDLLNSLSKPGDYGHKCGFRFLIIDNSRSFEKNLTPNSKHLIECINQNCELDISYDGSIFTQNSRQVEVLTVLGNLDEYVQNRSQLIANRINNIEKTYVSLEEISADSVEKSLGAIMYIPIGKAGTDSVELPFSCKDENGTVAGQCIGYMAIGQSGSGKSSFFHSLVLNGCIKYSPDDLQFWLLDFKNGGASSKYRNSGLPHIKMIAENNRIDDALCLFQMILEEMERRTKAFNNVGVNDIIDYNEIAKNQRLEHFPRIIIAIDEVQEIFRDDSASVIKDQIGSISNRMRSAGMHFVMVAQNLSEGKSYMLKEVFLPSATGRICFRVASDIPRDSGFEEEFVQRKQEISELKTGEAYIGYGKDTIKKVKIAYISPQEMIDISFPEIRKKYLKYSDLKPLIIGTKQRLSINSQLQGNKGTYFDELKKITSNNGVYTALIGEDAYRMSPLQIAFSQNDNSAVILLGSNKQISSSICASIALSLIKQGVRIHLFNGDRTKVQDEQETYSHAFMYVCQNISENNSLVKNYKMSELPSVIKDVYRDYLDRQAMVQEAEDDDPVFAPQFLIINDLLAIESFANNVEIKSEDNNVNSDPFNDLPDFDDYVIGSGTSGNTNNKNDFRDSIQNVMSTLVRSGWRYNIHVVLALKGESSLWRGARNISDVNNIVIFNNTDEADQFDNSYYLKEMLKNISNEGDETMAVWANHRTYSKIRPFIYRIFDAEEKKAVDLLLKGV